MQDDCTFLCRAFREVLERRLRQDRRGRGGGTFSNVCDFDDVWMVGDPSFFLFERNLTRIIFHVPVGGRSARHRSHAYIPRMERWTEAGRARRCIQGQAGSHDQEVQWLGLTGANVALQNP